MTNKRAFLAAATGALIASALPSMSSAGETIKIGEINSYSKLPAFTVHKDQEHFRL